MILLIVKNLHSDFVFLMVNNNFILYKDKIYCYEMHGKMYIQLWHKKGMLVQDIGVYKIIERISV